MNKLNHYRGATAPHLRSFNHDLNSIVSKALDTDTIEDVQVTITVRTTESCISITDSIDATMCNLIQQGLEDYCEEMCDEELNPNRELELQLIKTLSFDDFTAEGISKISDAIMAVNNGTMTLATAIVSLCQQFPCMTDEWMEVYKRVC